MIVKEGSVFKIYSKHKDKKGKRKVLGTFRSKAKAQERLRQIEYFSGKSK